MRKAFIIIFILLIFSVVYSKVLAQKKDGPVSPVRISPNSFSQGPIRAMAVNGLPPAHYLHSLGFICRQEWKLEKNTKLPLRIRLGSLNEVDKLEGKQSYHRQ